VAAVADSRGVMLHDRNATHGLELLGQLDRLLQVPRFALRHCGFHPVGGGDAHEQRLRLVPYSADGRGDLHDRSASVLEATTVLVRALVGQR